MLASCKKDEDTFVETADFTITMGENGRVDFRAVQDKTDNITYDWYMGDGNEYTSNPPQGIFHYFKKNGTYKVKLVVNSNASDKFKEQEYEVTINNVPNRAKVNYFKLIDYVNTKTWDDDNSGPDLYFYLLGKGVPNNKIKYQSTVYPDITTNLLSIQINTAGLFVFRDNFINELYTDTTLIFAAMDDDGKGFLGGGGTTDDIIATTGNITFSNLTGIDEANREQDPSLAFKSEYITSYNSSTFSIGLNWMNE
jgi:hypothetical protein